MPAGLFNGSYLIPASGEWFLSAGQSSSIHWRHPLLAVLFLFLCSTTIFGNCLVVMAVFTKRYLRNPTGYLIVSLAVADLIVGLVVMPLNSLFEMSRHVWLLGLSTCDIWHALDILASTSSIWNLCVISLDRYMAGVDPIGYRDRVSKRRIIYCIFFVWMVSACISFPAIFWWRTSSPHLYDDSRRCLFTDDLYYVVFSSLISFYIPLVLILFAYGRVYCIATTHSRSMKCGEKKILLKRKDRHSGKSNSQAGTENSPRTYSAGSETMRIHFGQKKIGTPILVPNRQEEGGEHTQELRRKVLNGMGQVERRRKGSANSLLINNTCLSIGGQNNSSRGDRETASLKNARTSSFSMHDGKRLFQSEHPGTLLLCEKRSVAGGHCPPPAFAHSLTASPTPKTSIVSWFNGAGSESSPDHRSKGMVELCATANGAQQGDMAPDGCCGGPLGKGGAASQRRKLGGGVREKSRQVIKQLNEQRAARTLSIVVGVFIVCWAPFFLVTPLMVLCGDNNCFANHETVFSFITWAGHLNSMLNPLIYSRFSRDFRKAFKQILTCERERPTKKAIKSPLNIMLAQLSSMAQIAPPTIKTENSEA